MGIPFKPGASIGTGDMSSIATIPGWVSIACPLRYIAPEAVTSNSKRNNAEAIVMVVNFLAAILLCLIQKERWKERIIEKAERKSKREEDKAMTP